MSISGHWFDPETAEQYIERIGSLQQRVTETYQDVVQKDLKQISEKLDTVAGQNTGTLEETRRELREIVDLVGRYKRFTASSLLEIELEVKQIKAAMEKTAVTELDLQKLGIEKSKLQMERWKLVLGIIGVFVTGLLFPIILWWLGVVP